MGEETLRVLIPLVEVLLGALVVHFSTTQRESKQRKLDARALVGMLAAEMDAMIRHAEWRGYQRRSCEISWLENDLTMYSTSEIGVSSRRRLTERSYRVAIVLIRHLREAMPGE